jgi:hypothetical protein
MRAAPLRQVQTLWVLVGLVSLYVLPCAVAGGVPIAQIMRSRATVVMEQPLVTELPGPISSEGLPGEDDTRTGYGYMIILSRALFPMSLGVPYLVFTKLFRVKLSGLLTKTQPRTHAQEGAATDHHAFQPHVCTLAHVFMMRAHASRSRPPPSPCLCSSCRKHADDANTMHARALRAPTSQSMIRSRLCVHITFLFTTQFTPA